VGVSLEEFRGTVVIEVGAHSSHLRRAHCQGERSSNGKIFGRRIWKTWTEPEGLTLIRGLEVHWHLTNVGGGGNSKMGVNCGKVVRWVLGLNLSSQKLSGGGGAEDERGIDSGKYRFEGA